MFSNVLNFEKENPSINKTAISRTIKTGVCHSLAKSNVNNDMYTIAGFVIILISATEVSFFTDLAPKINANGSSVTKTISKLFKRIST